MRRYLKMRQYISTHTSLAGRDAVEVLKSAGYCISTHTSLAGRDIPMTLYPAISVISTHTSLAGRDEVDFNPTGITNTFLLTRPSRDVT